MLYKITVPEEKEKSGMNGKNKAKQKTTLERPVTTAEFFGQICRILEENGEMPEILDYHLPTSEPVLMTSSDFVLRENLDYGNSEGIYLDLHVKHLTDDKIWDTDLGTFKTLRDDPEAMRLMGCLLADFIVESRVYVRNHSDDFMWEGFKVYAFNVTGKPFPWSYLCHNREDVERQKEELLKKYPCVVIRDNETREEWTYYH